MRLEDSVFISLQPKKITFPFGDFFFFEKFVVAEICEGIHFGWDKVMQLVKEVYRHYGTNFKIAYISNRINSYSIEPVTWMKLREKGYNFIVAIAVVSYSDLGIKMATLEKVFASASLKRCYSLNEAIKWVGTLKEFN